MIKTAKLAKEVDILEKTLYASIGCKMQNLIPAVDRIAKRIDAIIEDKAPDRSDTSVFPPRYDKHVRYKKEDIREEDKADYKDTLFDPDLRG